LSPRTGRPKGANPIEKQISIRLDAETEEKLREYCEKNGVTRGEAIRRGIHLLWSQKK